MIGLVLPLFSFAAVPTDQRIKISIKNETAAALTLTKAETNKNYLYYSCASSFVEQPATNRLLPGDSAKFTDVKSDTSCSNPAISDLIVYTAADGASCTFGFVNAYYNKAKQCSIIFQTASDNSITCPVINVATSDNSLCQFDATVKRLSSQKSKEVRP
ncbi:MAG: hypothetical protein HWD59_05815 [Coxiellaceae bacterium]|nr:MAG: hypothetical protein HWD59_05815 [Coxiellaceae bacterium]